MRELLSHCNKKGQLNLLIIIVYFKLVLKARLQIIINNSWRLNSRCNHLPDFIFYSFLSFCLYQG